MNALMATLLCCALALAQEPAEAPSAAHHRAERPVEQPVEQPAEQPVEQPVRPVANAPIVPPQPSTSITPEYPAGARQVGAQGDVVLVIDVDETGRVSRAEVIQGVHELLDLAALEAAHRLVFEPATQAGQPVAVTIEYHFRFDLGVTDQQGLRVPGSLQGEVRDPNGLPLPGAVVTIRSLSDPELAPITRTTRGDGVFRAPFLPTGEYELSATFDGFGTFATFATELDIRAGENITRNCILYPTGAAELTVTWGAKSWREVERAPLEPNQGTVTGEYTLTRRDIEATPGSMEDVTRALHSLPGIVSDGDLLATFNARGGDTKEVVFLLDRVPLSNPFHLAGFNSLFNPDLISTVQFYAGTAPATTPSATSAVLSVETWDGSPREDATDLDGAIDISASSLRLLLMGPMGKRSTIALAARRSYMETYFQVMKWANVIDTSFAAPEFSELSGRFAWRPDAQHRVMLTALRSGDSMAIVDSEDESLIHVDATFELSNSLNLYSLDHRYQPFEGTTWQTTLALTRDESHLLRDLGGEYSQDVATWRTFGRTDLQLTTGKHQLAAGVDGAWVAVNAAGTMEDSRQFPPWYNAPVAEYDVGLVSLADTLSWAESSLYVQDTWDGPVRLRAGGRASYTGVTGELLLSPRAGISVPLKTGTVPKASWGLYHYTPTDPRVLDAALGNPEIGSERAAHYVVGVDQGFPLPGEDSAGLLRIEAYHIDLRDLVVITDELDAVAAGETWTNAGSGTNQGLDLLLGMRAGRWASTTTYSLLFAERTNPLASRLSQTYAPAQDQRHTFGASAEFQVSPAWRTTLRYSFHTGRPVSTVAASGADQAVITCVNCDRLGSFHNIDVRAEWRRALEKYRLSVYVEVLNATNFKSDFVPLVTVEDGEVQQSMFSHLPIRPFAGVRADF